MSSHEKFDVLKLPLEKIVRATNNFAEGNLIGQGGFGKVYKGEISLSSKPTKIAARRLHYDYGQGGLEFWNEISLLANLKHENLVSFIGFCDEQGEKIIIHEYEVNESLDKYRSGSTLTWMQRLQICVDVAHVLNYIHCDDTHEASVIHGNIKSSKILLDENWKPKLSGFEHSKRNTKARRHRLVLAEIVGTIGYVDPTYEKTGFLSHKSDVYSLGVVLFEVLCGRGAFVPDEREQHSPQFFTEQDHKDVMGELDVIADPRAQTKRNVSVSDEIDDPQTKRNISVSYLIDDPQTKRNISVSELPPSQSWVFKPGKRLSSFEGPPSMSELVAAYSGQTSSSVGRYTSSFVDRYPSSYDVEGTSEPLSFNDRRMRQVFKQNYESPSFGGHSSGDNGEQPAKVPPMPSPANVVELPKRPDSSMKQGFILEPLFTMKRIDQYLHPPNEDLLAPLVKSHFDEKNLDEIMDPDLRKQMDPQSFKIFSETAYNCLKEKRAQRPNIDQILRNLEKALKLQMRRENPEDTVVAGEDEEKTSNHGTSGHLEHIKIPLIDREVATKKFTETYPGEAHMENNKDNLQMSFEEINKATEHFSSKNLIGGGGFGKVFKGEVKRGNESTTIVAKRWDRSQGQGEHHFVMELEILFDYKHQNIIGLEGYCNENDEKIIVYEHASNISLDRHLNEVSLTWTKRLNICIDIVRGLAFLHGGAPTKEMVIHRDIKSANILLNDDWRAKISDFGLSAITAINQEVVSKLVGTVGYVDPQYEITGFFTEKSDIYSLGVVLFEILYGKLLVPSTKDYDQQCVTRILEQIHDEEKLKSIVFMDIKEQIAPKSLSTFQVIVSQCLVDDREKRPTAEHVLQQLEKSLEFQEDYDIWEARLRTDYQNIIRMSKSPIDSTIMKKDLYDMFSKGILLKDGKVWFSLGTNGERNEMISARKFSYKNRSFHTWRSVQESRFQKAAKMWDISKLEILINITTQFLSPNVNYGAHLIFKFCDKRKLSCKSMYVNLKYKKGANNMHAYFAKWRDNEWMMVELDQFLCNKEDTYFEVLLESFSRCYFGRGPILIEGIEFRAIEKNEDAPQDLKLKPNKYQLLPSIEMNRKKHLTLSAKDVLYESSNVKCFHTKPSAESRFEEVIELLPQQVFRINCKIQSQLLSRDTDYLCYLVFKLSEKCRGLHCPVIVRNILHRNKKEAKILYFRPPNPWNLQDDNQVPEKREDGWMEVIVGNFNSTSELRNDYIPINLKLITYEGTMSGLIVSGLEIRPM